MDAYYNTSIGSSQGSPFSASFPREETKGRNRTLPNAEARNPAEDVLYGESEESSGGENILTLYLPPNDAFALPAGPQKLDNKCLCLNPAYYANALIDLRAVTAPARPRSELEKFKCSTAFVALESAAISAGQLVQANDGKFDLESAEGQKYCKKFLAQIEGLYECFRAKVGSRGYRERFSQAYKVLYKEGTLGYLTEILDSAQERFPYLWVNGEKYVFTPEVLKAGEDLFRSFSELKYCVRNIYMRYFLCSLTTKGYVKTILMRMFLR